MKRMKKNPRRQKALKYQIEPCTYRSLAIIYSKVKEISVRLMNWDATARPMPASMHTSGT